MVTSAGENNFVQGNAADVLGIMTGSVTYTRLAGWKITIPSMIAMGRLARGELNKTLRAVAKQSGKRMKSDDDDE